MMQRKINIDWSEPQVMAILNVTPDSFYSNSRTFLEVDIEARTRAIIDEGASIIDIGGYSSRPRAEDITLNEEWGRVERALSVVRGIDPTIVVSVDTFRSSVARRAIEQFGAVIINDISAGEQDPELMAVAAEHQVPYVAMHMRGTPQTMQQQTDYKSVVDDVVEHLRSKATMLRELGVEDIILDPGFGFAKSIEQNYELMAGLNKLCALDYPVLSGISRKSMIYKPLAINAEEALTGTIALNWESLRQGASILRVHDVREAVEIVKIFKLLKG